VSRAFDLAIAFILSPDIEGEYSNDPLDPGGETRFGVSKRAYPSVNISTLTRDQAVEIYRRDYWDACHCEQFPVPIAIALFDGAVNQGPKKAIKTLQQALGVTPDGIVGDETLEAANRAVPNETLVQYLSRRAMAYSEGALRYRRGWFVRLFRLQRAIVELA
jgi:lysozyme family protein